MRNMGRPEDLEDIIWSFEIQKCEKDEYTILGFSISFRRNFQLVFQSYSSSISTILLKVKKNLCGTLANWNNKETKN